MSNLYKNIATLCEEKGIKGAKLCNDIGMSKGILTDLKMGRKKSVNAETAQKIASYFGVSVGYLLGEEEKEKKPVNEDELPINTIAMNRNGKITRKTFTKEQMETIAQMIDAVPEKPKDI